MNTVVSHLYLYPVKSLGAVPVKRMSLVDGGPAWDRRWIIIDCKGRFITQREFPELNQINVTLDLKAGKFFLQASGYDSLTLPLVAADEWTQKVTVWRDQVQAVYGGEHAEQWISAYLNCPARFAYMPAAALRTVDQSFANEGDLVSFADGFPLLLTAEESLEDFNGHLERPVEMLRFRPNIVVTGSSAYAEDSWVRIEIGQLAFRVAKPCARCVIPSINLDSGQKEPEVARALARYRRGSGGVYFGQNLIHESNGEIQIGDRVNLLEAVC